MKKVLIFALITGLVFLWTAAGYAFVRYEDKHPQKVRRLTITGFHNYAPFGYVEHPDEKIWGRFFTVFQPMIDTFRQENNLKIKNKITKNDYEQQVIDVRQGEIDIALGVYHHTEAFRGLEILYPAAFINPITAFVLPNRVNDIKNLDDLKKLKGVRWEKEIYTDFAESQLKEFDIVSAKTPFEMFELLFTKKVDYILASQYFGLIEASKLGLRNQISVAKQTLWQLPMFIGVSKFSKERKMIAQKLTRYLEKPENRELLKQNIIKIVEDAEIKAQGIVPPTFGLDKSE